MLFALALSRCKSKEDAEDVCQEVLIALLNKNQPFKNDEHMKAWLIKATIDRSKNVHRYEKRHPRTSYDPALHDEAPSNEENDKYDKLHEIVEILPGELKETLQLYYRDGYSTKEIASKKGIAESSVRARLHRARKKIAACLTCLIAISIVFGVLPSVSSPCPTEAMAIDFSTDETTSVDNLPIKAIQKTNDNKALVTFEAKLKWTSSNTTRVVYSSNAENIKLYSPSVGNYYSINNGKLGSTGYSVQTSNGQDEIILNVEIALDSIGDKSNEQISNEAKDALRGNSLFATAYSEAGEETASCQFV